MKIKPATYFTKDGKEIIIRQAEENDAVNLLALKLSYLRDTNSIPLYEHEYKNDVQTEMDFILRYISEANSILLVAEHSNNLIGNIDLTGSQRKKLYHTGMVGMGIAYKWHSHGIGSMLLQEVMKWAREASPLTIVWLEVYSTNIAGRKLYEKCGFETCGHIKNFFMDNQADKITMVNYLK